MSAVLTGTSSIDVSALENATEVKARRSYCTDCDVYWVQSPVCPSCYEEGIPYVPLSAS